MHTTLQPAAYCELALAVTKDAGYFKTGKNSEQSASNMAARTLQMHMRLVVAEKGIYAANIVIIAPVDATIISKIFYQ